MEFLNFLNEETRGVYPEEKIVIQTLKCMIVMSLYYFQAIRMLNRNIKAIGNAVGIGEIILLNLNL